MTEYTYLSFLEKHAATSTRPFWLRDLVGDDEITWSFKEALAEIKAVAAWIEDKVGDQGASVALLSRNRAHWMMSDIATMTSGNVTVPLFQTMAPDMIKYICDLTDCKILFVGEAMNWAGVKDQFSDYIIVAFPGFEPGCDHIKWGDILNDYMGKAPGHKQDQDALASIVFSSGTTGKPKGIMHSQASLLIPSERCNVTFKLDTLFSYLPLSHIAERDMIEGAGVVEGGAVTFAQSMETMTADLARARPSFFFGPPRVWEQLQMGIISKFGGTSEAFDAALEAKGDAMKMMIKQGMGFDKVKFALTGAAPIAPSLLRWFHEKIDIPLREGFGLTEIMTSHTNIIEHNRIGSIGRLVPGVEHKLTDEQELAIKAPGIALGYYKNPEATAETFRDGWIYTGDKARIDEDGYVFITGRVKDTFKTIQGKFVSPAPIEKKFSVIKECPQLCLLGRGYSKTVMVCVVVETLPESAYPALEETIRGKIIEINETIEHHARVGAVIICKEPWTIENNVLTHTMKIKRDQVEALYGEKARELALKSAQEKSLIIEWV